MNASQDHYDALNPATRRLVDVLDGVDLMPLRVQDRVKIENAIRGLLASVYDNDPAPDMHDNSTRAPKEAK